VVFDRVEVSNFPEIDEIDKELIQKKFYSFLDKVSYVSVNPILQINAKEYDKGGLKRQHEIRAKLDVGGDLFVASHTDWQLISTIQTVLDKLEKEVLKKHSKK
jgi:ribosome-associated translation inhibitor RaiA